MLDANNTSDTHITLVRAGDTVLHNGEVHTVCASNLHTCPFMGVSLFGDTYALGNKPVKVLVNTPVTAQ